jgi:tight adherence protein C
MNAILLLTALLVIPAGFLIVMGDDIDPIEEAQRIVRKNAKKSGDRTQLRSRLEELGRASDKEYVDFRIKQYGYCAAAAVLAFTIVLLRMHSVFVAIFSSMLFGIAAYILFDRALTKEVKKRRELIESEFPAVLEILTLAISAGETPMSAMLRIAESADGLLAR